MKRQSVSSAVTAIAIHSFKLTHGPAIFGIPLGVEGAQGRGANAPPAVDRTIRNQSRAAIPAVVPEHRATAAIDEPKLCAAKPYNLFENAPKARPVVGGLEVEMLGQVAGEGEQARPLPELEDPVQVELLACLLRKLKFVVADEKG